MADQRAEDRAAFVNALVKRVLELESELIQTRMIADKFQRESKWMADQLKYYQERFSYEPVDPHNKYDAYIRQHYARQMRLDRFPWTQSEEDL